MTRYANLDRNADIIDLFRLGIPPKRIPKQLREKHPDVTIHIVYHVTQMFQAEQSCEILRNGNVAKTRSTA